MLHDHTIKPFDNGLAECFNMYLIHNHDEIVAADVPDKIVCASKLSDRLVDYLSGQLDYLAGLVIAIAIVIRLEIVQVGVTEREWLAGMQLAVKRSLNGDIAW